MPVNRIDLPFVKKVLFGINQLILIITHIIRPFDTCIPMLILQTFRVILSQRTGLSIDISISEYQFITEGLSLTLKLLYLVPVTSELKLFVNQFGLVISELFHEVTSYL